MIPCSDFSRYIQVDKKKWTFLSTKRCSGASVAKERKVSIQLGGHKMKRRLIALTITAVSLLIAAAAIQLQSTLASGTWTAKAPVPEEPGSAAYNSSSGKVRLQEAYGQLPLSFEANSGQTDPQVKFLSRGSGYSLFLTNSEAVLVLTKQDKAAATTEVPPAQAARGTLPEKGPTSSKAAPPSQKSKAAVLRMKLVGAKSSPKVTGQEELPGNANYLIGNDPKNWRTNVNTYGKVRYEGVYPGIDVLYYGNQRQLEYDFVVAPGSDPARIRLGFEGARKMRVEANGALVLETTGGSVRWDKPLVYQESNGVRNQIEGKYRLRGGHQVSFEVAAYDANKPLIIDPVLIYSTYLGGGGADFGFGIAVDGSGSAYVTGYTVSTDFPTANALQPANGGNLDAFVAKLNAAGSTLVYSSYLGGSGDEFGFGIAVDGSGNAYLTGRTGSTDFPTANALQPANAGGYSDVFVAKLNTAGSALVYSTYLGGSGLDDGRGIAVDGSANAYLTGYTESGDFPTANALQPAYAGIGDAFVAKLNAAGSALTYSTYLGGSFVDNAVGIAADGSGNAYVTGETSSTNFPTANAVQPAYAGAGDAFVAKLNAAGSALLYSTYFGGGSRDSGSGIAVDGSANAYVTGFTQSTDFPTANALQPAYGGGAFDGFVAELNAAGSTLLYSTYLGGNSNDFGVGITVDGFANAYVTGETGSTDFPTANAVQPAYGGGSNDAFVAKINAAGSALLYSTYLGGSFGDTGWGIAVDGFANAYITGGTGSTDFPTANALQPANAGGGDVVVAKIGEVAPPPTPTPSPTPIVYNFTGFFQPVDNLPTLNVANAGRAIPVRFSLSGGQGLGILAPGYPASGQIACNANEPGAVIEETVTEGGSTLTYDAVTDQYTYVWRTDRAWQGSCRILVVRLIDGTDHIAKFKFR